MHPPVAVNPPCVHLRAVARQAVSGPLQSVDAEAVRKIKCDPEQVWRDWRAVSVKPSVDWRTDVLELLLQVTLKSGPYKAVVRCLVDSGARLPITVREGLLPTGRMRKAKFPVTFSTVAGQHMKGGQKGVFVSMHLPVQVPNGTFEVVKTQPLFAYEAAIAEVDVIIGYPFLKAFNLMVDCGQNCLRAGPPFPKERSPSPCLIMERTNTGLKGKVEDQSPQPSVAALMTCDPMSKRALVMEGDDTPTGAVATGKADSEDEGCDVFLE